MHKNPLFEAVGGRLPATSASMPALAVWAFWKEERGPEGFPAEALPTGGKEK